MLIAYSAPTLPAITLAGAAWLTADGGAACIDGKPARRARANGTPTITLTYAAAFVPRVIAVLGLRGVSVGDAVVATTGAGGALGGNAATQTAVRFADGSIGAWIVTDGAVSTSTVRIALGTTGTIDIGELAAMAAVDIDIEDDWAIDTIDPTATERTVGSQPSGVPRLPYRTLESTLAAAPLAQVRGGGLAGGMDWDQLRAAMAGNRRIAVAPRWHTPAGAVDADELNRTAIYGTARIGAIVHRGGNYYSAPLTVHEAPAGA